MRFSYLNLSLVALIMGVFTFTALGASNLPAPQSSVQPIDQIAAIVNDTVITQSEVDSAYQRLLNNIRKSGKKIPDESTLKNEILNQLIYRKLQLQLAKRYEFKVSSKQLDAAIDSIAKQHKMTMKQLIQKVKGDGFTFPQYRKEIENQIMITMVQHQALGKEIEVTNADVDQFLTKYKTQGKFAARYHLIDVLIALPAAPTSAQAKHANAKALGVLRKLSQGADVYEISGVQVTDMGWRTLSTIPDAFTRLILKTKVGNSVGPVRAQNGYHIIKLTGVRKGSSAMPDKNRVRQLLLQQKFQKALQKWLVKIRKKSTVRIVTPQ